MASQDRAKAKVKKAKARQAASHRAEVSNWLSAGALAVGLGAALVGGSGIARADEAPAPDDAPGETSLHAPDATDPSSVGVVSGQANRGPTRRSTPLFGIRPRIERDRSPAGTTEPAVADADTARPELPPAFVRTGHTRTRAAGPVSHVNHPEALGPVAVARPVTDRVIATRRATPTAPPPQVVPSTFANIVPVASVSRISRPTAADPVQRIVAGLFGATGFNPAATPGPAVPATPSPLGDLVLAAFRRVQHTFFNARPTANPMVNPGQSTTGVVTGTVNATDADGDSLTYAVGTKPVNGKVVVDAGGSFVYTPSTAFAHAGGTDTFTVTVAEANADQHLHGPVGLIARLLGNDDGSTVTKTITIAVVPVNSPPVPVSATSSTDPATGIVTGTVVFTDADHDDLTYSGSGVTSKGAAVVNADGSFTYTPSAAARHEASVIGAAPGVTADAFTVTVVDGHGGVATASIPVNVLAANATPVFGNATSATDPDTGVVTGVVGFTDSDHDTLTYSTTTPANGTVMIDQTGAYSYTPTDAARLAAAAAAGAVTDSFTVTASDGHGGATPAVVTVTVSPTPQTGPTVGTPSATTGAVAGTLGFTQPASGALTYTVTPPANGAVTVDAAGAYSYTPTVAARLAAGASTTAVTDTFTVTASDGQSATVVVPVGRATLSLDAEVFVGASPAAIVLSPDGSRAYVSSRTGNSVSVIDTATNTKVATVSVPEPGALAISPDGKTLYVASGEPSVVVINTATNTIAGRVAIGLTPTSLAISPDDQTLYGGFDATPFVVVIDTTNRAIRGSFAGASTPAVAISPDGTRVYVINAATNGVNVYNPTTGALVGQVSHVGGTPTAIAVSPDGTRAYVTTSANTVAVVNATTLATSTVNVGNGPSAVAVSADGHLAYVTNAGDSTVSVIDTATNTVVATVSAVTTPSGVAVSPDGTHLYVVNSGTNSVTVFALASSGPGDAVNHAPVGPGNITRSTDEDTPVSGNLLTGASDLDGDDLDVTVTGTGQYGTLAVNRATGAYTYTPGNLKAGQTVTDTFTYTVTDGVATTAPATLTITATGLNDAPVSNGFLNGNVNGNVNNANGAASGTASFTDVDGDPLAYAIGTNPTSGTAAVDVNGNYVYIPTGAARFEAATTSGANPLTDSFTVIASDGQGGTASVTVFVRVDPGVGSVTATVNVGADPERLVISPDGKFVYVSNGLSDSVSVIDTATNTVVATVGVGDQPEGIAVSPDGKRVYVANFKGNSVSVIDTATNTTVATVGTGAGAWALAVSPDGSKVYVANQTSVTVQGGGVNANTVVVINTDTNTVVGTPIAVGAEPRGVVFSPDGKLVYVTSGSGRSISKIDTATGAVTTVGQGGTRGQVAISPDGNTLYLANQDVNTVMLVNTSNLFSTLTYSFTPANPGPQGITVSPDGKYVFVANFNTGTVTMFDPASGSARAFGTIAVGQNPTSIAVSPDGNTLYVTNGTSGTVSVITLR